MNKLKKFLSSSLHVLLLMPDILLSDFKSYRKLRGGIWYGYHLSIQNFLWERNIKPEKYFGCLETEDYTKKTVQKDYKEKVTP